jgi:hypothetical protein
VIIVTLFLSFASTVYILLAVGDNYDQFINLKEFDLFAETNNSISRNETTEHKIEFQTTSSENNVDLTTSHQIFTTKELKTDSTTGQIKKVTTENIVYETTKLKTTQNYLTTSEYISNLNCREIDSCSDYCGSTNCEKDANENLYYCKIQCNKDVYCAQTCDSLNVNALLKCNQKSLECNIFCLNTCRILI